MITYFRCPECGIVFSSEKIKNKEIKETDDLRCPECLKTNAFSIYCVSMDKEAEQNIDYFINDLYAFMLETLSLKAAKSGTMKITKEMALELIDLYSEGEDKDED
jgi:DNA-directed RNA polymerase subunit RPC12/RpoP